MAVQAKTRIGILLTKGEAEAKKEDLIGIDRRSPARPWLKGAPEDLKVHRKPCKGGVSRVRIPAMVGYPEDVSVGAYVKFNHGNEFEIDYIHPEDVTPARLRANDINFMITYDLLEAYHVNKTKKEYHQLKKALQQSVNVFPDYKFQEFVNSKIMYYNYLKEKGIPVQPSVTITSQEWKDRVKQLAQKHGSKQAPTLATLEVIEEIKSRGIKDYICKPEYGQEAHALRFFTVGQKNEVDMLREHLMWNAWSYPGIIIQEVVPDFGSTTKCPELRMYFVGKKYQHCLFMYHTKVRAGVKTLAVEGGKHQIPPGVDLEAAKRLALRTVNCLPDIALKRNDKQVVLPKLLTRIDVGCIRNGKFDPWVNEIEFVPSLFVEFMPHATDGEMGKQMAMIAKTFVNSKSKVSKKSTGTTSKKPFSVKKWAKGLPASHGKVIKHGLKKASGA